MTYTLGDSGKIFALAAAFVMFAFGFADTAEIEADRREAKLAEAAVQCRHDLVEHRAALQRMRMADDRDAVSRVCFGHAAGDLDRTGRSRQQQTRGCRR